MSIAAIGNNYSNIQNMDPVQLRRNAGADADADAKAVSAEAEAAAAAKGEAKQEPDSYTSGVNRGYKTDTELVNQLKADMEANQQRFLNTVKEMLGQQGIEVSGEGIWKTIAKGDYKVDPEIQAEARRNISEDGYWGVEQTSDRIVKYAVALTGGDPDKLDSMVEAFEKGFKEAEKAWGGQLPDISQRTRDAVYEKFDALKKQNEEKGASAVMG